MWNLDNMTDAMLEPVIINIGVEDSLDSEESSESEMEFD
jgi:hypothetical protein